MRYSIQGDTLPVVICELDAGEKIITEGGGMAWMSPNMKMETTGGGIGKMEEEPYPVILFFRIFTLQNVLTE